MIGFVIQFFELQWPFAIHYIYTLWVLTDKLHELQSCNSLYIWCNSLQLYQNNSFSTTMQFHYYYTHDVMLTSLIVIHLLNMTCSTIKIFGHYFFFQNIDLHCTLWLWMMVQDCDMWHNTKFATWHINYILEYIYFSS